jgi:hypothetical protein
MLIMEKEIQFGWPAAIDNTVPVPRRAVNPNRVMTAMRRLMHDFDSEGMFCLDVQNDARWSYVPASACSGEVESGSPTRTCAKSNWMENAVGARRRTWAERR